MGGGYKFIKQSNKGVSAARNLGIQNATGKWITFVDADDMIQPNYFENLLNCACQNPNIEMVQAGCTNYTKEAIGDIEQSYPDLISLDSTFIYNNIRGLAFSKLFLRSVIEKHKLQFDEKMPLAEDLAFTLDYINHVGTVAFSSEVGYLYRHHPESVTSQKIVRPYEVHQSCFLHLFGSIDTYVRSHDILGKDRIKREQHIGRNLFYTIYSLYQNKLSRKERLRHLKHDFNGVHYRLFRSNPFGNSSKQLILIPLIYGHISIFDSMFIILYKLKTRFIHD